MKEGEEASDKDGRSEKRRREEAIDKQLEWKKHGIERRWKILREREIDIQIDR